MKLISTLLMLAAGSLHAKDVLVYVGTYTGGGSSSKGISLLKMNSESGALTDAGTVAELASPSFLALSADGSRLYAVSESGNSAAAFTADAATGALTKLNELPVADTKGQGACHLCLVPSARMLVTANYGGGSTTTFSLKDDGSLNTRTGFIQHKGGGPNASRQKEAHGHGAVLSPDGKYVLVNDLGTDRVYIYSVVPAAQSLKLTGEGVLKAGAGPRHGAFDPAGHVFYSINELDSTITPLRWNAKDATLMAGTTVSTLPAGFTGDNSTAEIAVHPSGKFLYGSNRGHDSLVLCRIDDPRQGTLSVVSHTPCGGKTPRNFTISPDGRWLLAAHERSDSITAFKVDSATGALSPVQTLTGIGRPVCLIFKP